jgi:hypothetical protein
VIDPKVYSGPQYSGKERLDSPVAGMERYVYVHMHLRLWQAAVSVLGAVAIPWSRSVFEVAELAGKMRTPPVVMRSIVVVPVRAMVDLIVQRRRRVLGIYNVERASSTLGVC